MQNDNNIPFEIFPLPVNPWYKFIDRTGQEFNDLKVIGYGGKTKPDKRRNTQSLWICRCKCGNYTRVRANSITGNHTKSCGCKPKWRIKHGMCDSPEYAVWAVMAHRCTNPNSQEWENYGSRGISMAKEWTGDGGFTNFFNHVGKRPSSQYSIDRIDNNKGYEPGNVRWATKKEQARNTRKNRVVTFNGKTQVLAEWAIELEIHPATLSNRLKKWPIARALTEPVNTNCRKKNAKAHIVTAL